MAEAPEIKVKLTAEDAGVAAAIKELTSQLKNLKKQQDETATSGLSLATAFKGIVAVIGLQKIAEFGKEVVATGTQIARMSQISGASSQTLSVFNRTAAQLGVSTEAVDKGFIRVSKSILEFEQGSQKAAKGFALLGITAKDFAGLNTDQKIKLVTDRLGGMAEGTTKAGLAQQLLGRGGAELIPVLNELAGEGFEKARASAEKFGLLLDNETTTSMLVAKKSFQDLEDAGKGMATQFETGLVPAITDIANALVKATTKDGVGGFRTLGEEAGKIFKGMVVLIVGFTDTIVRNFAKAGADIQNIGRAIGDVFTMGFSAANKKLGANIKADYTRIEAFLTEKEAAIFSELQGNTRQQDIADQKAKDAQRTKTGAPGVTAPGTLFNAAARANLALLEKQLQDELSLHRAYAKQAEQVDKEMFEKGEISLAEYYAQRRTAIQADADEEVEILRHELKDASDAAAAQKAQFAKLKAPTDEQKDKQKAADFQSLAKIDELQTKITETQVNAATKVQALNAEEFKAREENQNKILEFEKLIDTTGAKRLEAAKAEIAIEKQKLAIILAQSGASQAEIDKELARYEQVKLAEASYTQEEKESNAALKDLADQRAAIEDQVKNGKLFQVQADEQIRQLELARLPVLQQIADQLLAQAKATGDPTKIAQAEDFQKQVNQIGAAANQVGQQIATIKQGLQSALTGGIEQFFGTLMQGTVSVGQAFKQLAGSIVSSLARMMAQMLAQVIVAKMLKAAMSGFAGGGLIPGGNDGTAGGTITAAEGGLISGPGGPKSDSIPARVSPGEFIVSADAVSKFGAGKLEAINRGFTIPSIASLSLPKFAEGGLVGAAGTGGDSNINLGIGLDEGLILKHLSSKAAGNIILQHLSNNPKAASKAISRSS